MEDEVYYVSAMGIVHEKDHDLIGLNRIPREVAGRLQELDKRLHELEKTKTFKRFASLEDASEFTRNLQDKEEFSALQDSDIVREHRELSSERTKLERKFVHAKDAYIEGPPGQYDLGDIIEMHVAESDPTFQMEAHGEKRKANR